MTDFENEMGMSPPQKVGSKILEPYDVSRIFSKNRRLKVGPNRGAKSQFGITGLYP